MLSRLNIFQKIITLILALLIPVLLLYTYSYKVSVHVVNQQIESSNENRLDFFIKQLDSSIQLFSTYTNTLLKDPNITEYQYLEMFDTSYNRIKLTNTISDMLKLQISANNWNTDISVYFPSTGKTISTNPYPDSDGSGPWLGLRRQQWNSVEGKNHENRFVFVNADPSADDDASAVTVKISFSQENIREMLSQLKQSRNDEPFLYSPGHSPILSDNANSELINKLINQLHIKENRSSENQVIHLDGKKYSVSILYSQTLGWYLVNFVPLEQILAPITSSRNWFYVSTATLLGMTILASLMLYRNVQLPIRKLVTSFQRLQDGNYSFRTKKVDNPDFNFLFQRFNDMAAQIQKLIENVYMEKIRSRESKLKYLQSQINPHFLYNCLSFIKNSAEMKHEEAVVEMSLSLGEYYRYATRSEKTEAPLRGEMDLVRNYLTIQSLRMPRLHYDISIPDNMLVAIIPRLIIQPVVENAILHGFEQKLGAGCVKITGGETPDFYEVWVEDDGRGMTQDEMERLKRKITESLEDGMGCGLWNVHQRLIHQYGQESGLSFDTSPLGGLRVQVRWRKRQEL